MSEIVELSDNSSIRIEKAPFSMVAIGIIGCNIGCSILLDSDEFKRFLNEIIRMKEEMEDSE